MSDTDAALKAHNDARAHCSGHHRPSLTWSSSLASAATAWAEHMASTGKMEHSGTPGQGENLYAASPDATFEGAVRAWLGEEREYDGGPVGEGFRRYGHYTQCVWPRTTEVGMGKARAKEGGMVFVCARYSPAGNVMGESAH